MNEKKQLTLIWISTVVLFVLLVVVTIITSNNEKNNQFTELEKNRISSIITSDTVYPQKAQTLDSIAKQSLAIYRAVNIKDYNQLSKLAEDMGLQLSQEECLQSYCTWKDKENIQEQKYEVLLDFDPGYQKISLNSDEGIPFENIGITSPEEYQNDPTIIPEKFLKYYLAIDTEYFLQSENEVEGIKIYNFNRLIDGKKLFILSSVNYSDYIAVKDGKIISASLHMFTYASAQQINKVEVDQKSFDEILLSKSNIVTFMQTDYTNILNPIEEFIVGDVEYFRKEIPSPSTCTLTEGEIGYYLNTSSTEKTLVPIYRGTCTGNSKYEGEEYTVNGLIMFELF